MRLAHLSLLSTLVLASPSMARAQAEPAGDPPATETPPETAPAEPSPSTEGSAPSATPAHEERSTSFDIRRGFFAESDLGVFLTFGGRNTNDATLPKRAVSNVQPYLGITLAYDVLHSDAFSLALGLKFAAGYTAGSGRVSEADLAAYTNDKLMTRASDFALMEAGAVASLAFMVTDRLAVTVKIDGGAGIADPNPLHIAGDTTTSMTAVGAMFGAGAGVEYFTLLNDFSVGLDARFTGALVDGLIPGLSVTIPVKYTF